MIVRCRCCHRSERRSDGSAVVLAEGGARRSEDPDRDAFLALAASAEGETGPVVARCPACGGPMVSDDPAATRIAWTLPTPQGPIVFGADGSVRPPLEVARRMADQTWPPDQDRDPSGGVLQSAFVFTMVAPVVVWLGALSFVVLFLIRFGAP
jgi:hypothetical protein